MPVKNWPQPPLMNTLEEIDPLVTYLDYWYMVEIKPVSSCKHGRGECERCGTTDRRDVRHTTRGGRGVVARLKGGRDRG